LVEENKEENKMDIMKYTALEKEEIAWIQTKTFIAPEGWVVIAGTYKGGDAMATRVVAPDRDLLVIDSFEGLSNPQEEDACEKTMRSGAFDNGGVSQYLAGFTREGLREPDQIEKMWITEDTIKDIPSINIAFLWLDLDLYEPTLACLRHFGPMMVTGGIMMTHDFGFEQTPGIEKACLEYGGDWKKVFSNMYEQIRR
jgi:hypothetical protein